jgi:putative transport protein
VSLSRLLDYDVGTAAGLLAGAFSESTVIGTASQAIQRLAIPEAEKARLVNNIPVAYAVTYLVGTTAVVALLASVAPRLLRVDLRQASRALEAKLSGRAEPAAGVRVGVHGVGDPRLPGRGTGLGGTNRRADRASGPGRPPVRGAHAPGG